MTEILSAGVINNTSLNHSQVEFQNSCRISEEEIPSEIPESPGIPDSSSTSFIATTIRVPSEQ